MNTEALKPLAQALSQAKANLSAKVERCTRIEAQAAELVSQVQAAQEALEAAEQAHRASRVAAMLDGSGGPSQSSKVAEMAARLRTLEDDQAVAAEALTHANRERAEAEASHAAALRALCTAVYHQAVADAEQAMADFVELGAVPLELARILLNAHHWDEPVQRWNEQQALVRQHGHGWKVFTGTLLPRPELTAEQAEAWLQKLCDSRGQTTNRRKG